MIGLVLLVYANYGLTCIISAHCTMACIYDNVNYV